MKLALFCLISLACAWPARAQLGDHPGEAEPPPPAGLKIPPAPALPPQDALKTFTLPPGFRIELVAAEPLVGDPVAMAFGPDGRIWVAEMRGYMPNIDGTGEDQPTGRIVVLSDTNGDGRMDKSTVFLDGLVLPRAVALAQGGVLAAEPPHLWYCRDTNGDDVADTKEEIDDHYGNSLIVEHTANGLLWAMDNWIYSANYTVRFRNLDGLWQRSATISRGQWGITQDDFGRLFYNSNSDQLRGDLLPAEYLMRNPHFDAAGADVQMARDQRVWPGRVNPGVNRGYQASALRNGRLAEYTAACAPLIYRGDNFPAEFEGNAFVCEPAGNLIRRNRLFETNGVITARNAYHHAEFLTSIDERFRPVFLSNGPDGALYIVDMYHGILQHKLYMTTFLRRQSLDRRLDKFLHRGRIYRVRYVGKPLDRPANLGAASSSELVRCLFDANGWRRDTAQRLLIERRDLLIVPKLRDAAAHGPTAFGRLQALWTLDGLDALEDETLLAALADPHPQLRAAAIRLSESHLREPEPDDVAQAVLQRAEDDAAIVRRQCALSLGESQAPWAEAAMARLLTERGDDLYSRDAVVSGLEGRELPMLERLLGQSEWRRASSGRAAVLEDLAKCIFAERRSDRVGRLLAIAHAQTPEQSWRKQALVKGILGRGPRPFFKPVRVEAEPALCKKKSGANPVWAETLNRLDQRLVWPGKPGAALAPMLVPLTEAEQKRFDAGRHLYPITCGACHQLHGNGQAGIAPPLNGSEWVLGPSSRTIRIALKGLRGPISVEGETIRLEMPPMGILDDEQVADLLTYIRRGWDNSAGPVSPAQVADIRRQIARREAAWTESELLLVK